MGAFSILTLDGDNDTWSVTLFTTANNRAMRAVRDPAVFRRVVGACPNQAHWLDGAPITPVEPMAGIIDRYRRFVVDDRPVATGFAVVGDAWACTNPSAGRGLSVGILHAQVLRDAVRRHGDDPRAFALAYDAETERQVTPFYRNQIQADRIRVAEMHALLKARAAATQSDDDEIRRGRFPRRGRVQGLDGNRAVCCVATRRHGAARHRGKNSRAGRTDPAGEQRHGPRAALGLLAGERCPGGLRDFCGIDRLRHVETREPSSLGRCARGTVENSGEIGPAIAPRPSL